MIEYDNFNYMSNTSYIKINNHKEIEYWYEPNEMLTSRSRIIGQEIINKCFTIYEDNIFDKKRIEIGFVYDEEYTEMIDMCNEII